MWLRRLLGLHDPDTPEAGSSADELREAKQLQAEQRRHVDAIADHIETVSARVRGDAMRAEERLIRR